VGALAAAARGARRRCEGVPGMVHGAGGRARECASAGGVPVLLTAYAHAHSVVPI